MAKDKRYTVVIDAFLYARNDNEAKVKAAKVAEFLRTLDDNRAQVLRLDETPVDYTKNRIVHLGKLEIFENKLV